MWRVAQELVRRRVLVASVDLMTTPTVAKLAEKLARTIHEDVASREEKALDRLRIFSSLRVKPIVNVDPDTGKLSFGFDAGYAPRTCARRSSTCSRSRGSSAPSASAAWR